MVIMMVSEMVTEKMITRPAPTPPTEPGRAGVLPKDQRFLRV
jgi:hypothetical protein